MDATGITPYQANLRTHQLLRYRQIAALLDQHYPAWREARAELNALPL